MLKKVEKKFYKLLAGVSVATARRANNSVSMFGAYQPVKPKGLEGMMKKKK